MDNEIISFENKSNEELAIIESQLVNARIKKLENESKKMKLEIDNKINDLSINQKRIIDDNEKKLEVQINSMRVKSLQCGYMTQSDFGNSFTISLGPKIVGKLFKVIGLAQNKNVTKPYRYFVPKYAKSMANETYSTFIWNYENCLIFLEQWLIENGYYEMFYSKETEKDLEDFIDELYDNKIGYQNENQ